MAIVDEIYEALTDDEALALLPERLRSAVPATRYGALFSVEDGAIGFYVDTPRYTAEEVNAFMASDMEAVRNPFLPRILANRLSNRAVASASLMAPSEFERTEYYNELCRMNGDDTTHLLFAKLDFEGGYSVLTLQRGRSGDPFSETDVATVQPLVPHLRRVLGMRARLAMTTRMASEVLALAGAVLVTDAFGRLLMATPQGERLLAPPAPLMARNGRLHARHPASDARLQALVHAAGHGIGGHGGALLLRADVTRSLRVLVTPWHVGSRRRVAVLVDDPGRRHPVACSLLTDLYGLSAAEAETAGALAQGLSPAEVAEARGVSIATIRTQIHHALRKSDARTIGDLMRLVASLPTVGAPRKDDAP